MSVFDVPRLHFAGTAWTSLPTGPRSGLFDVATNTALTEEGPFPLERDPREYQEYLRRRGPAVDARGRRDPDGVFSAGTGPNFAGSGHFRVEAGVVSVETRPGDVRRDDPVVGRGVDMWGHYNEYLATTFNRARVFDIDPSSNWTTTLMVGHFCFGRLDRSLDTGYMVTGPVRGVQPPRWHRFGPAGYGDDNAGWNQPRCVVHQFVVRTVDGLRWLRESAASPAVTRLGSLLRSPGVDGLVVQFGLYDTAPPPEPDSPGRWALHGTIAPWNAEEPRTEPPGRLLTPTGPGAAHLPNLTVEVADGLVTLNMINALAPTAAEAPDPAPPGVADLGDLELRTSGTGERLATLDREHYQHAEVSSGVVTVPAERGSRLAATRGLYLARRDQREPGEALFEELETRVLVDDSAVFVEHARAPDSAEHDHEVTVRTFHLGHPAPAGRVYVRQFHNPRSMPRDETATSPEARPDDVLLVWLRGDHGRWGRECETTPDRTGRSRFTVRGARGGATRLLVSTDPTDGPHDGYERAETATARYDNHDELGYWSTVAWMAVRVLPNHWHLDEIPQEQVTFDVLYRHVFACYEQCYSFMRGGVFSLADRFRVETHPDLIWQMCDPANRDKTYYMPPTRDLTLPQSRLLLKFLRQQREPAATPTPSPVRPREDGGITTRRELVEALRHGVRIELAVMLQYLYAAFSVPTYGAGREHVRTGAWTEEQLRLACGDGGETRDGGIRGTLLEVAREEMIHFLVVNNVLMAVGEPFYVPDIDFGSINHDLMVPLDFALEPLHVGSLQRFVRIEQPEGLDGEAHRTGSPGRSPAGNGVTYDSLSELYAGIRQGLQRVPGLFAVEPGRGGGEHHLFLRGSLNTEHPDYQLEVDDLPSALFAIDFVTEQGEGGVRTTERADTDEQSHYDTFLRLSDLLMAEHSRARRTARAPWTPAHPVVRNPTLRADDRSREHVSDPAARELMLLFNRSYSMMLELMVQHFGQQPDASLRRSTLMNTAIDVMTGVLRPVGELLVTLPSGRPGKTAGPSFELEGVPGFVSRPDVAARVLSARFDELARLAGKCSSLPERVTETLRFLASHYRLDS
ncbi:ferritin-like domain-containing protein [Actinopolyspora mortivallis]|uniref:VioB-polyketide synthase n=2 Tax=Actinopolyspora TaxID=1849 RepID=A0A2T0GYS2_ACTMO|nr:ferritin-like domain-containing protein [Actinopolyspora mortivallis]PRW64254.1 VioB - polyketide synthase [Actinopolyspora mortivallis]